MRNVKIVSIIILVVLTFIVVLQNTDPVETQLLWMNFSMPAAALLFSTLVIGFALGVLAAGFLMRRGSRKVEKAEK